MDGHNSFDDVVLPHVGAGYRLARWMLASDTDAEDAVQEASLRALRYFGTFSGGNGRAWFLRVVRNTCITWRGQRPKAATDLFDEQRHGCAGAADPETLLLQADDALAIRRALDELPDRFRELLVLREIEGLSYQELSDALGIPLGTVMSRLSRGRQALRRAMSPPRSH